MSFSKSTTTSVHPAKTVVKLYSATDGKRNTWERRRADQIGGAQKKQKVDSVTQQDLEDVT